MSEDKEFQEKLKSAVPPWAIALCAVLFAVALTFRIIGIDVSGPLNTIFAAKAKAIEVEASAVIELDKRVAKIEADHK